MADVFELPEKYMKFINEHRCDKKEKGVLYERHHILPRTFGGRTTKDNMCLLRVKDHFKAHYILAKETNNSKCWAIVKLLLDTRHIDNDEDLEIASIDYEKIRLEYKKTKSIQSKKLWENEEYRNYITKCARDAWNKEGYRENRKEKMKVYYEDEKYRKNLSDKMKKQWEIPEKRKLWIKNIERTPENIEKQRKSIIKTLSTPEARLLKSKRSKENWQNPEYRKRQQEAMRKYWEKKRLQKEGKWDYINNKPLGDNNG